MTTPATAWDLKMDALARDLQKDPVAFYSHKIREETPSVLERIFASVKKREK